MYLLIQSLWGCPVELFLTYRLEISFVVKQFIEDYKIEMDPNFVKKKIVWIINHYAQTPTNFGGTRHYSLAKYLFNYDWEGTIISSSAEINTSRQLIFPGSKIGVERHGVVNFCRIKTVSYKTNGLARMLNMLLFSFRLMIPKYTSNLKKPDLVIGSTVHPFAALAAYFLAKKHKVPFIFEVRDLWPQTLIDMGHLAEKSLLAKVLRKIEFYLALRASRIITLLPKASDYFCNRGIDSKKIVWIPNGVDLEYAPEKENVIRKNDKKFILQYFGAHGKANNLSNILKALAILKEKPQKVPILFQFIGDGPEKPELKKIATDLDLKNVEFLEPVSKKDIYKVTKDADAFIFNLAKVDVFKYGISSNKLFDFMLGVRPVIFCCNAANNPIEEAKCGISVQPEDPQALAQAIVSMMAKTKEERLKMGLLAREHVMKNYDFNILSERLSNVLNTVKSEYHD